MGRHNSGLEGGLAAVLSAPTLPAGAARTLVQNIDPVAKSTTSGQFVVLRGAGGRSKWAQTGAIDVPAVTRAARGILVERCSPGLWLNPDVCRNPEPEDGVEGQMSPRPDPRGRPVCSGVAPPECATGGFRAGQDLKDQI